MTMQTADVKAFWEQLTDPQFDPFTLEQNLSDTDIVDAINIFGQASENLLITNPTQCAVNLACMVSGLMSRRKKWADERAQVVEDALENELPEMEK